MDLNKSLTCPKCSGKDFNIKREATYLYTYKINSKNLEEISNRAESVPFLFDNREKETSNEYLECEKCGSKYPISVNDFSNQINLTILQKAIRGDNVENPEFLG